MHLAAQNGHIDVVRLLLEMGADVQIQGEVGVCAVHVGYGGSNLPALLPGLIVASVRVFLTLQQERLLLWCILHPTP
jgi:hypothetical protein